MWQELSSVPPPVESKGVRPQRQTLVRIRHVRVRRGGGPGSVQYVGCARCQNGARPVRRGTAPGTRGRATRLGTPAGNAHGHLPLGGIDGIGAGGGTRHAGAAVWVVD